MVCSIINVCVAVPSCESSKKRSVTILSGSNKHACCYEARKCSSSHSGICIRRRINHGPGQPYIFEVQYFDGELLGSFFIGVDGLGEEEHFRIPYALGADIDFAKILPRPEFKLLKTALERTLIAEDGQAFSLVVIAPELPNQDFEVAGIHFRNEGYGTFRARPIYLFLQATSQ